MVIMIGSYNASYTTIAGRGVQLKYHGLGFTVSGEHHGSGFEV